MLLAMAYVVARPRGRFEIRESVHTPKGPRARTLANFEQLTDKVLDAASRRASRPFDADAVRASGRKAITSAAARRHSGRGRLGGVATPVRQGRRRFVESSRRMAAAVESRPPPTGSTRDPGDALIDLLGLVAQVSAYKAPRPQEPLLFPPLARLRAERAARTVGGTD
jgi:hypothetical protein